MNKKRLKNALFDIVFAVLAGYILMAASLPSSLSVPLADEPRLMTVQVTLLPDSILQLHQEHF